MNIFIDGSLKHIKIRGTELYISRLVVTVNVNGDCTSNIVHMESSSPEENSLLLLDEFSRAVDRVIVLNQKEAFSAIRMGRCKYRGFEVFTSFSVNNLIKVDKKVG